MKRVLVISHNVFCDTSNMGKTLSSYFSTWDKDKLAQLYIHSEIPTSKVCCNYYRITDKDILKSIVSRKSGNTFSESDICEGRITTRTDSGLSAKIYQKSRKRTPLVYFLRNFIWSVGAWNTRKLNRWINDFDPEAVFFASGDYAFMYKIALSVAETRRIPLYIVCFDDYYLYNRNTGRFLGKFMHSMFMKSVRKAMTYSSGIFTICENMANDYQKLFPKPFYVLHTASSFSGPLSFKEKSNRISYIGNLSCGRNKQLADIAEALQRIDIVGKPDKIDVYSTEKRPEVLDCLVSNDGINLCGALGSESVKDIMANSMLLIHAESFDPEYRSMVKYSISTKIPDSLASGTCILAYGPGDVSSIKYLLDSDAAYCITNKEMLDDGLCKIISNLEDRDRYIANALHLSLKNHSRSCVTDVILNVVGN